jgi:hypothetical protein|tara:strand:- start:1133 stop:1306 length:174 start_codon:yes stop_codon:yes gene_type:complete
MSKLVPNVQKPELKLSVKDTDFLLKLIMKSAFEGVEIESAYNVIQKLSEMHRKHLED